MHLCMRFFFSLVGGGAVKGGRAGSRAHDLLLEAVVSYIVRLV